jgi:DNA-3-methyladenine glycosylase
MKALPSSFFNRPAPTVAHDLIGCHLIRQYRDKIECFVITETEAYDGFRDKASHASRGLTKRNAIMFRKAGHIYVYFTYGMHWMLNIVTGQQNYPAAVLIRGIVSKDGAEKIIGPAKLTKRLGITGLLNGKMLGKQSGLWIEKSKEKEINGQPIVPGMIERTARIGVDYAGPFWSKKKWRFVLHI